ncbi:succinyl-diaminopimelate desuccinylase [Sciscionella sediminilitoris]|uniref:succinyl-diaminopimelate desuccinylase n=1 Tax=Sciscionella sediminilitoris TaxID=1445613 RepID=UPI0004DF5D05|nr:succinyl-diaminopimelate desuccinylase [Sciscionella sp. SE31]
MAFLDPHSDPVDLTAALVDIRSVSGEEEEIADAVHAALQLPGFEVRRSGNAVLARTSFGLGSRTVFAGHLDTVPVNENLPVRRTGSGEDLVLHGCGTVDMKGGDAVLLHLAALAAERTPLRDLTFVFYDCEEVDAARNGLGRIERDLPEWLQGDLAVVGEPSNGVIEAGCQGTMRFEITLTGERAHTARGWMGRNAIHGAADVLATLRDYQARTVEIDGCEYREGLQAVRIGGGVAGNVVPDECVLAVNFRFAPDRGVDDAQNHLREVFAGHELSFVDVSPGALPGLTAPAAAELVEAAGGARAKLGWTDVARFAALGMPAVNFGPGDPTLAHTKQEHAYASQITECARVLREYCFG